MKNLKWIFGGLAAVLGVYLVLRLISKQSAVAASSSPTASTGTFGGFDNLFSGLLNKPNYTPAPQQSGGNKAGQIIGAIQAAAGAVPGVVSSFDKLKTSSLNPFNWGWFSNNPAMPSTPQTVTTPPNVGYDSIDMGPIVGLA